MPFLQISSPWTGKARSLFGLGTASVAHWSAPVTHTPLSMHHLATSRPMPGSPLLNLSLFFSHSLPQAVLTNTEALDRCVTRRASRSSTSPCAGACPPPQSYLTPSSGRLECGIGRRYPYSRQHGCASMNLRGSKMGTVQTAPLARRRTLSLLAAATALA